MHPFLLLLLLLLWFLVTTVVSTDWILSGKWFHDYWKAASWYRRIGVINYLANVLTNLALSAGYGYHLYIV